MQLTVDEAGRITVSAHQEGPYTPSDAEDPDMMACKAAVGAFALPEGSQIDRCGTIDWNLDGTEETCEIVFLLNGSRWYCLISNSISMETMQSAYAKEGVKGEVSAVGGCTVTTYGLDEGIAAVWQDQQGRTFRLESGGETAMDDVSSLVLKLTGEQNG